MSDLILNSLQIKGFRGYKHLEIDNFRRLNLVVGTNSVGKTSLLEAIQLLIERPSPELLLELLDKRNEGIELNRRKLNDDPDEMLRILAEGFGYLFYGRPNIDLQFKQHEFEISGDRPELLIKVGSSWFEEKQIDEKVTIDGQELSAKRTALVDVLKEDKDIPFDAQLGVTIQIADQTRSYLIHTYFSRYRTIRSSKVSSLNVIGVEGLDDDMLAIYWSRIILTDHEPYILEAIRIISPDIEDFGFRDDERGRKKYPIVRLKNTDKPIPFHSLGEGSVRILGLILALVNSRDGVLLIDEIDTGLHHSVQIKVWNLLFSLAKQLNVQLFATTHSQDCLSAFEYVANEYPSLGYLISLSRWQEFINVTLSDENEMKTALENDVELRGTGI